MCNRRASQYPRYHGQHELRPAAVGSGDLGPPVAQLFDSNFSTDSQHPLRRCSCARATLSVRTGNGH